jgi:hypothetical protein
VLVDDGGQRGHRADHSLTERDDREQSVPFRDVMRMPRCDDIASLGQPRPRHLEDGQHRERHQSGDDRQRQEDRRDPTDLRNRDHGGVGQAGRAVLRVLLGRT